MRIPRGWGLALAWGVTACSASTPNAVDQAKVGGYAAEQTACVDHAASREAADVCRADVRRRYGVALDGGADG